ncbi:MAG: hypothetical protein H0T46_23775, partial [Deltaproteobacteria bacterium]|nr:hypothetical protein [Deltaproteobacteria bacterium]
MFSITLTVAACGDDGGSTTPDAPKVENIGFNKPTMPLKANMEISKNNWMEIGPADLTCLGTANNDMATTVAVTLSTTVKDFQSGNAVPGTVVTVFKDQVTTDVIAGPATADGNAMLTLTIPAGTKRFGFKMTNSNSLDTLLLNQTLNPTNPTQMISQIQSVSTATAQTLPALIGVSRTPGTGILAGAVRDCTGKELSNYVATVSSVEATATSTVDVVKHLPGVDAYYFSASVGLPVRHSQQDFASKNGLFMAIEMAATPTAYVQVWGYKTQADVDADKLSLIAQLKTAVIADVVITGSYDPI